MLNWIVLNRTDYLHKMDLALNNLQRLICHKTQQTNLPIHSEHDARQQSVNNQNSFDQFEIRSHPRIGYFLKVSLT